MRSSSVAVRLLSLLSFLLLIGILAYWSVQLLAPRAAIAPNDSLGDNLRPPLPAAAKLFGARNDNGVAEAPPPVDIRVTGILEAGRRGIAILSVNGAQAKAYRVDQRVGDGTTLKEVHLDKVIIEHRGQRIESAAPPRYSLDVLGRNAGHSSPPPGIEQLAPIEQTPDGSTPAPAGGSRPSIPSPSVPAPDSMPGEPDMPPPAPDPVNPDIPPPGAMPGQPAVPPQNRLGPPPAAAAMRPDGTMPIHPAYGEPPDHGASPGMPGDASQFVGHGEAGAQSGEMSGEGQFIDDPLTNDPANQGRGR
ncbi:MAG: type II secretion system protein N [Lautropia sp.]|nr:type II secretion system protein N [Lautropia sp.]